MTARDRPDVALVGLGASSEHALELITAIVRGAFCPVIALLRGYDAELDRGCSAARRLRLHRRHPAGRAPERDRDRLAPLRASCRRCTARLRVALPTSRAKRPLTLARRRQVLELHDGVVQALTVAQLALDLDRPARVPRDRCSSRSRMRAAIVSRAMRRVASRRRNPRRSWSEMRRRAEHMHAGPKRLRRRLIGVLICDDIAAIREHAQSRARAPAVAARASAKRRDGQRGSRRGSARPTRRDSPRPRDAEPDRARVRSPELRRVAPDGEHHRLQRLLDGESSPRRRSGSAPISTCRRARAPTRSTTRSSRPSPARKLPTPRREV